MQYLTLYVHQKTKLGCGPGPGSSVRVGPHPVSPSLEEDLKCWVRVRWLWRAEQYLQLPIATVRVKQNGFTVGQEAFKLKIAALYDW